MLAMVWAVFSMVPRVMLFTLAPVVGLWLWFQWRHRALLRIAAKLPVTYPTLPLLGHAYICFYGKEGMTRRVLDITLTAVNKGLKTVCFWVGPLPLLAVHDIDDIQMVLNSSNTLNKSSEYEFFMFGLDLKNVKIETMHTLMTAPANVWKVSRRYLNNLFHQHNLQHMTPVFNRNCRELVSALSEREGRGPFDVFDYTMDLGLKTVCELVFGPDVEIDVKTEEFKNLRTLVETVPDMFIKRMLLPWLRMDSMFNFFYKDTLIKLNNYWKTFSEKLIEKTKEKSKRRTAATMNSVNGGSKIEIEGPLNIADVYTVLRQKYPEFNENNMIGDILVFYCTGTDTIGLGVASCMLALAQYQDIQERLYSEISSVVGPDDDVTLDDISRMPYLDQVIKESLRRFTTVPFVLRKPEQDMKLSDCVVPAGYTIIVSLAALHMNPEIYPDPHKFDPDRFSSANGEKKRSSFLPFSGGPRNCIAKTYAMQLMKMLLVHVLRRFRLRTDMDLHKLKMKLVVTLVSSEGYQISLERRS